MTYNISLQMQIKTFKKIMTHSEMQDVIFCALMESHDIRDVVITSYEGDTINNLPVWQRKEELTND